jgi:hypothetical protein
MNHPLSSGPTYWASTFAFALVTFFCSTPVAAAPGAHGPNGEHLDGPATAVVGSALPRMETKSEAFELVATLHAGELSVLIDRYATNEPVLNATLEVESGGIKSQAKFHSDQGDYSFEDAKLLALLRAPGEHALVFTLLAGKDNDLLDGKLVTSKRVNAAKDEHDHHDGEHNHALERAAMIAAGLGVLGLVAWATWWRKRRNPAQAQRSA